MLEPCERPDRAAIAARLGVPDERLYMTVDEFADLPSDVHHAVWKAYNEHRISSVPAARSTGSPRLYNRFQVLAIAAEVARG